MQWHRHFHMQSLTSPNAKLCDTKCFNLSIRWFCIRIEQVMTVYENYNVIAFKSSFQKFTVYTSWNNSHQISTLYLRCYGLACKDLIWTNALWSRSKREIHRSIANWSLGIFSASKGTFMSLQNNFNHQMYRSDLHTIP